jgi:hypothetical protein
MVEIATEIGTEVHPVGEGIVEGNDTNHSANSRAKDVVTKGIDYTLLIVLLVLQYMKCKPPSSADEFAVAAQQGSLRNSIFGKCEASGLVETESIVSIGIIVAAGVTIAYGVLSSIFVWVHASYKFNKKPGGDVHSNAEMIYEWTDKIIIIDSILEIPISFVFAPIMTVFLWAMYAGFLIGLYFMTVIYADKLVVQTENGDFVDSNAEHVFNASSFMVALSLLKLTGAISQYWVIYKASFSYKDAKEKVKKLKANRKSFKDSITMSKKSKISKKLKKSKKPADNNEA